MKNLSKLLLFVFLLAGAVQLCRVALAGGGGEGGSQQCVPGFFIDPQPNPNDPPETAPACQPSAGTCIDQTCSSNKVTSIWVPGYCGAGNSDCDPNAGGEDGCFHNQYTGACVRQNAVCDCVYTLSGHVSKGEPCQDCK